MKIVSFTRAVPFEGIPHAGGEYYLRHVESLIASGHQVVIVAPEDPRNVDAASKYSLAAELILVDTRGGYFDGFRTWTNSRVRPAIPSVSLLKNLKKNGDLAARLREADLFEYQWTETAGLHKAVSLLAGKTVTSVCVAHDVLSQKFRRSASSADSSWWKKVLKSVRSSLVTLDERRMLDRVDQVITFSDKDRDLLVELGVRPTVTTLSPPLEPSDPRWRDIHHPSASNEVLFNGAFTRPENDDAARWLMREIWPLVLDECPDAQLKIVGGGPTEAMLTASRGHSSISILGYVDDLVPHYESAAIAVIPLREGAGVKFKTITAMLWRVPLVSTSVGIEGIADRNSGLFAGVEEHARGFAKSIVTVLKDPSCADTAVGAAYEFAVVKYGKGAFQRDLDFIYGSIVGRKTVTREE